MQGIGFFELLLSGEESPVWGELSAGVVVLRIAAAALGGAGIATVPTARALVLRSPSLPIRSRLLLVLDHLTPSLDAHEEQRVALGHALYAMGMELHAEGHLKAAIDVFSEIVLHVRNDTYLVLASSLRIAYAYRLLKDLDEAELRYQQLRGHAQRARNVKMGLEADLGLAKIAIERGNIPQSATMVGAVLNRARRHGIDEIIGKALMDRAAIAGIRRDPVGAIVDAHEAIPFIKNDVTRHRLLFNMATSFREVGHAREAIRLAEFLRDQGAEAFVRMMASVLRYNLAVDAHDDIGIERARRQCESVEKPPLVAAEYFEALARDHAMHGRFADAEIAVDQMRDLAIEYDMNEVLFRADAASNDLGLARVPAIYDFRPAGTTTAAERNLATVEERILELCAT